MRILLRIGIAVAVVVVLLLAAGLALPRDHVATVEARFPAPADSIRTLVTDVAAAPTWRSGLERVDLLSGPGEPVRWREHSDWGVLTFVREEQAPHRIVHRIVDEGQGFGGAWTFEVEGDSAAAILRITEQGYVSNPVYRVMSRLMGYHDGMETYARDLARRLNVEAAVVRR